MAKFNKASSGNISVFWTMLAFVILGVAFTIIGFYSKIMHWMEKFGITLLICALPVAVFLIFRVLIKKIREM